MGANQSFNFGNFGDYDSGYTDAYQFDPEKQKAFSGMWSKLGKENESSSFDWDRAGKAVGKSLSYLDQTRKKAERDDFMSQVPRALGRGTGGFSGQVLDNLGVVYPPQQAPIYIPGTQSGGGGGGLFGAAGGLAGSLGTAAGIFGPLGAPIGAGIGGMIDRFV